MKTYLINATTKSEENFIETLFKKLGVVTKTMTQEEVEDYGLLQMIKEVDRTKKVSKESIINKLKKNYAN